MKTVVQVHPAPSETEVQPEPWELLDPKDSLATQERPGSRARPECRVRGVLQGKTERWDQPDLLDLQAEPETEENKDLQESLASRVFQETKVHLERPANLETSAFPESWVPWGRLDPGEREGSPGREESWVIQDYRDLRASPELQDQTGPRAVLDPLEQPEMEVLQVYRECPEREASLDPQDPKETGERWERKDLRELQEMTEPEALRDQWDQPDLQDPAEKRVNQDLKDPWDR